MPNYNPIAASYDFLSRLVFGKAQVRAQTELLKFIPAGADVLIVGGGTGWILEELVQVHTSGLRVVYVDHSGKMIAMARRRNFGDNAVTFIEGDILNYSATKRFDVIMTPFLFDNFSQKLAETAFDNMHHLLKPEGIWLYTDFCISNKTSHYWQRILLGAMYFFFKIVANVNAGQMPEMQRLFNQKHYKKNLRSTYYKGLIESIIYQKSPDRRAASPE